MRLVKFENARTPHNTNCTAYINTDNIIYIIPEPAGSLIVIFGDRHIIVKESVDEVAKKLGYGVPINQAPQMDPTDEFFERIRD